MTGPTRTLRLVFRGLTLLPAALLLLALVAGVLHHHEREDGSHSCAICSLSHTPAMTTPGIVGCAPVARSERVVVTLPDAPVAACPSSASSRSPPSL